MLLNVDTEASGNVVLACQSAECTYHSLTNLSIVNEVNFDTAAARDTVLVGEANVFSARFDNNLFLARPNDEEAQVTSSISKVSYSFDDSTLDISLIGAQKESSRFQQRDLMAQFIHQGFIYYVFDLVDPDELHIARYCLNDAGRSGDPRSLTTYTEAHLVCNTPSNANPTAAAFLELNGQPFIILTVRAVVGNTNRMCLFNVTEIDERMNDKLDTCARSNGQLNLQRYTQNNCPTGLSDGQIEAITPCNRLGDVGNLLEVDDEITTEEIYSITASSRFSTISIITYNNVTYLYAGGTGVISQFHISHSSNLSTMITFIRTIEIAEDEEVLSILASEDRSSYFVLTATTIYKRQVDICAVTDTCETCAQLNDPICGWCSLRSMCTQQSDCTTDPPEWRDQVNDCPSIISASPRSFYTPLTDDGPIKLNTTNIPAVSYDCVFQFASNHTLSTPATASSDIYTCSLPSSLPPFDTDTLSASLSLQANNIDVVTTSDDQEILFTNCSTQTRCFGCLLSQQQCSWCPLSGVCRSPLTSCSEGTNITASNPNTSCPFIGAPSRSDTNNYLIHVDISSNLVIRAYNLDLFNTTFNIDIRNLSGDPVMTLQNGLWRRDDSIIMFDTSTFNVTLDISASLTAIFQVFVHGEEGLPIENPQSAMIVFYSCPLMGINCGECLSIDAKFECGYDTQAGMCMLEGRLKGIEEFGDCEMPQITSFSPTAGPVQGGTKITIEGTNLGASASQVEMITITDQVNCVHNEEDYIPGRSITCTTSATFVGTIEGHIEIKLKYYAQTIESQDDYSLLIPRLNDVPADPSVGPLSGGTNVTVNGRHLGIGNTRTITMAGQPCIQDDLNDINVDTSSLSCVTTASNSTTIRGSGAVTVQIDGYILVASGFDYDNDPTFEGIEPKFSFASGGTEYTIRGQDFTTIQEPRLLIYLGNVTQSGNRRKRQSVECDNTDCIIQSEPCTRQDQEMTCRAPGIPENALMGDSSMVVTFGLLMDAVTDLLMINGINVTIYSDPTFNDEGEIPVPAGITTNLTLTGTGFFFSPNQIDIQIGDEFLLCERIVVIDSTQLQCEVEVPSSETESSYPIMVTLGIMEYTVGTLVTETNNQLNTQIIIISAFAAVAVFFFVVFIVVVSILCHKYKLKGKQNDRLLFELERLETSVAHECKLGFAELQTDLDELTGDLSGSRLPYHDFRTYILQNLFPGAKDHAVLHELELPSYRKTQVERGIRDFHALILDKTVLLTMIHAMESQRSFTIRDKSNMGSLLMLALHDRLDYATEILKRLLSDLVRRTVAESHPKLLLRRTESVAEKMLSSWLAFTMHDFVVEHAGQPLYLLFKAIKAQLEKGPIDVITGEARYSLSEQKLIRQQVDVKVINGTIDTDDGQHVPVKLLSCDSISQAKEKILDAVHKNAPVSQRPSLNKVDLEYIPRDSSQNDPPRLLRDEDGTNIIEYGWRRVNTLNRYRVQDRSVFRLVPRHDMPGPGRTFDYTGTLMVSHGQRSRAMSDPDDGYRIWHLFQQAEEDPRSSPYMSKKMVTEIYLPRMLSTKTILQKFVDDLFGTIFTLSHTPTSPSHLYTPLVSTFPQVSNGLISSAPGSDSLPIAIKYMFDFLDNEAYGAKINDPDVVHTWKNNSLALRFWVNLIKNPEFVFDINKSSIVDACLSVTAQAFIDGCSSSDSRPTINSPTSKLLYNKEVQGYKAAVKDYYESIQTLPRISDEAMMQYLKDLSKQQAELLKKSGEFYIDSALDEILRCAIKHSEPILDDLRGAGLESKAQIFESVIRHTS